MPVGFVPAAHELVAVAVFRGLGAPAEKSLLLASVSIQPPPPRSAAVVFESDPNGAPSEHVVPAPPYPIVSMTVAPVGHAVPLVMVVCVLISTTLPAVADIAIVPVASGDGNAVVPPAPTASCTR